MTVTFTPEQQTFVDALINRKYAEVQAKAEAKLKEELSAAEQNFKGQLATRDTELVARDTELVALKKAGGELEAERRAMAAERKQFTIYKALSKHQLVGKVEEIVSLLDPVVKVEGDEAYGIDTDTGKRALDRSGAALNLDAFVDGWLRERTYLLKTSRQPGGSGGTRFSDSGLSDTMRRADFERLTPGEQVRRMKEGTRLRD